MDDPAGGRREIAALSGGEFHRRVPLKDGLNVSWIQWADRRKTNQVLGVRYPEIPGGRAGEARLSGVPYIRRDAGGGRPRAPGLRHGSTA